MIMIGRSPVRQAGMVLLISLVFLLLLSLVGLSSMQGAISQQKVASSLGSVISRSRRPKVACGWGSRRCAGAGLRCHFATRSSTARRPRRHFRWLALGQIRSLR